MDGESTNVVEDDESSESCDTASESEFGTTPLGKGR